MALFIVTTGLMQMDRHVQGKRDVLEADTYEYELESDAYVFNQNDEETPVAVYPSKNVVSIVNKANSATEGY